jgi:AcrR family transcriptional regulator
MHLFWTKGYEGTTLTDLTDAIGVNRPCLYSAFGNKEELFKKAFARYVAGPATAGTQARQLPTARAAVESLLYGAAASFTDPSNPPGCFSVVGALASSDESASIQQELCESRNAGLDMWRERFEQAQREGDLPPEPSARALARYVMTVLNGMTIQARSGATQEELREAVDIAMKAWPQT